MYFFELDNIICLIIVYLLTTITIKRLNFKTHFLYKMY